MHGSGFIVGPKHKLVVEAGTRSSHDPLRNKTYVIDSMVVSHPSYNPLIELRDGKMTSVGSAYFWAQLVVDGQGVKRVTTTAVLFIAWAYRMSDVPTEMRLPWHPKRGITVQDSIRAKRKCVETGWWDILGSSMDLLLATETISLNDAIRGIHDSKFRTYLTKSLTYPMSVLYATMHSVSRRKAVMLFTMPELTWKGPIGLSRVYISTVNSSTNGSAGLISIPRRRADGGEAKKYVAEHIKPLYYDGRCNLPMNVKRRKGDVVNYDFEASSLPLSAVPFFSNSGQMMYELYLTRAVHVLHWITSGKLTIKLLPCHSTFVHVPRLRSVLDIIPRVSNRKCTFTDGHEVSWPFLHYLYWEHHVTGVTLIGSTCTAISDNLGTWLDLAGLSYTQISTAHLTPENLEGATPEDTTAAISESNIIRQFGCIPCNEQHKIRSPCIARPPIERLLEKGIGYGPRIGKEDTDHSNPSRERSLPDLPQAAKKSRCT